MVCSLGYTLRSAVTNRLYLNRQFHFATAMALLLHFLFLAILGACNCATIKDAGLSRRAASDWPVACFPNGLHVSGGAYSSQTNGNFTDRNTMYNGTPSTKEAITITGQFTAGPGASPKISGCWTLTKCRMNGAEL